jgi:hypothetical protein
MRLRYALVADYANVTGDGKPNVVGITDRLYAYQFPALHRELYVVNGIETDNDDEGTTQEILVTVIDPDGRVLAEIRGSLEINGPKQTLHQLHCIRDLTFAAPGNYQVNIHYNGQQVAEYGIELVQLAQPETA